MLFPPRCPRDGIRGGGDTWLRREDEHISDLRLHGTATHTRSDKEAKESESVLE